MKLSSLVSGFRLVLFQSVSCSASLASNCRSIRPLGMKAPKIGDKKDDKKKVRNARADKHLRKPQRLSETTLRVNKKQGLMGSLVSVLTPHGESCDGAFDWALSLLSMKRFVEVLVGWCWVAFRFFSAGRRAVRPVVRVCRCLLVLVGFGKDGEPGWC